MMLDLPERTLVSAEVVDVAGRHVSTLFSRSGFGIGVHLITWDGTDDAGTRTPPGVFFVRVRAGTETLATRIVQLR